MELHSSIIHISSVHEFFDPIAGCTIWQVDNTSNLSFRVNFNPHLHVGDKARLTVEKIEEEMEPKKKLGEDEVAEALRQPEPLQTEPTCPICGWDSGEIHLPEIRKALHNHALFHIAVSLHRDEKMTQAMERELAKGERMVEWRKEDR